MIVINRKILVILVVAILVLVGSFFVAYRIINTPTIEVVSSDQTSTRVFKLSIDNSSVLDNEVDPSVVTQLPDRLYETAKVNSKDIITTDLKATIRDSELTKTTEDGTATTTFMVDIPTNKQSYRVNVSRSDSDGITFIYILCPTDSDLIYEKFTCLDFNSQ